VALLERAADRAPDSRVIRYHLGMAQLQTGQRESARANLETALSGSGEFTGSQEARAVLASLRTARSGKG
jgi:Tfp pilus assembly protein PilF